MVYLKLYESFVKKVFKERDDLHSEYVSNLKNLSKKNLDELCEYMHEVSDSFPFVHAEFSNSDPSGYYFSFTVYPDDIDKLRENFHQGIFDRIIEDYPGTKISFTVRYNLENSHFNKQIVNRTDADKVVEVIELEFSKDFPTILFAIVSIYIE